MTSHDKKKYSHEGNQSTKTTKARVLQKVKTDISSSFQVSRLVCLLRAGVGSSFSSAFSSLLPSVLDVSATGSGFFSTAAYTHNGHKHQSRWCRNQYPRTKKAAKMAENKKANCRFRTNELTFFPPKINFKKTVRMTTKMETRTPIVMIGCFSAFSMSSCA